MFVTAILTSFLAALLVYLYVRVRFLRQGSWVLVFVFVSVSAVMPFLAYKAFQYYWYAQVLPSEIEIADPVPAGEESGFREGCGVAVYKLTASSLEAIKKKGLGFFEGATQARGYSNPSDHHYHYYTYQPWKETPIPVGWTSEGSWFMCSVIGNQLEREIIAAAKQGGAYYTVKHEARLLVIPSLGYVVFSSYG